MSLQLHLRHQRAHQALHIIEVSLVRSGTYHTCFRNYSCHCSSTSVIRARTKPSTSSRSAWSDQARKTHIFKLCHCSSAFVIRARTKPSTSSRSAWSDQARKTHIFKLCHCSSAFVIRARTKPSTSSRSAWSDQVDITHVFVMIGVIAAPPPSSAHAPSPPHHRDQPGQIR